MPRSKASFHYQPNDYSCGPAALKTALEILGKRYSIQDLVKVCRTTTQKGTSTLNLIKGINKLGFSVLVIEWATLRHLQSALKPIVDKPRAVIVNYQELTPTIEKENGHYATVAGFSARNSRIHLFDSIYGGKKTYKWTNFIDLWWDFDFRRIHPKNPRKQFRLARKYYNRLMLIIAKKPEHLPKYKIPTVKYFYPPYALPEN